VAALHPKVEAGAPLSTRVRRVVLTQGAYGNKTGEAWPSQGTLERATGSSRRSVNAALDTLGSKLVSVPLHRRARHPGPGVVEDSSLPDASNIF
jgi:hypothetical protein